MILNLYHKMNIMDIKKSLNQLRSRLLDKLIKDNLPWHFTITIANKSKAFLVISICT